MQLALSLTADEYGPFQLKSMPRGLNMHRVLKLAKQGLIKNYFLKYSATNALESEFRSVRFPIDRGIVGYRVAIIASDKEKGAYAQVNNVTQFRQYTNAQGVDWLDTKILKHHNLPVFDVDNASNIYELLLARRADFYFRGIHEWKNELTRFFIGRLSLDTSFALYYPLPRFFIRLKTIKRMPNGY